MLHLSVTGREAGSAHAPAETNSATGLGDMPIEDGHTGSFRDDGTCFGLLQPKSGSQTCDFIPTYTGNDAVTLDELIHFNGREANRFSHEGWPTGTLETNDTAEFSITCAPTNEAFHRVRLETWLPHFKPHWE